MHESPLFHIDCGCNKFRVVWHLRDVPMAGVVVMCVGGLVLTIVDNL